MQGEGRSDVQDSCLRKPYGKTTQQLVYNQGLQHAAHWVPGGLLLRLQKVQGILFSDEETEPKKGGLFPQGEKAAFLPQCSAVVEFLLTVFRSH